MKLASTIARYLLGLIFLVFGLNGFLHFIPLPPPPAGSPAAMFMGAIFMTGYFAPIYLLQVIPALLLLAGRYVPLALTLLAPIVVNILFFHVFMAPSGLPMAIVVTLLWIFTFLGVRSAFAGIFQQRALA